MDAAQLRDARPGPVRLTEESEVRQMFVDGVWVDLESQQIYVNLA